MKSKEFYKTPAWKYFSRYVLLTYSDGLIAQCFTCGKVLQINTKDAQCGHLVKITDSFATAFDFTNVGAQCMRCNHYLGGRQDIMYHKLVEIHGKEAIEKLYIRKWNACKLDKFTLDILAKEWKQKFDILIKIKKTNPWKR